MTSLTGADCQTCGACCAYSSDWPRFTMESEDALGKIPPHLVAEDLSGMRCEGQRCLALDGQVGVATSCTIYEVRPQVCRECQPNDEECRTARWAYGLGRVSV
ncbi:YkgJ family cysteine cluster protein [Rhizobium sp. FKY42]|uniref:YkgJ family cysteine cluster protein n=1 Tax=Rhizobium sp. FKY42 TaxID=2562310 RepID=UPI0010BFE23D|nr:YkgJ family cysteine cluster protein [Rhizobium sp. FKY42]